MQEGQIVDDDSKLAKRRQRAPLDDCLLPYFLARSVLKLLVKPMKTGVNATVLMDCCHSGTVLDLPYKFAADSKQMQREDGFDMEIITEAVRTQKPTEAEMKKARQQRKREAAAKEKAAEKRSAKKNGSTDTDYEVGPKLAPNGAPVLPTRPVANNPNTGGGGGGGDGKGADNKKREQATSAPAPPGQCCIIS